MEPTSVTLVTAFLVDTSHLVGDLGSDAYPLTFHGGGSLLNGLKKILTNWVAAMSEEIAKVIKAFFAFALAPLDVLLLETPYPEKGGGGVALQPGKVSSDSPWSEMIDPLREIQSAAIAMLVLAGAFATSGKVVNMFPGIDIRPNLARVFFFGLFVALYFPILASATAMADGLTAGISGCGNDVDCVSSLVTEQEVLETSSKDSVESPGEGSLSDRVKSLIVSLAMIVIYGAEGLALLAVTFIWLIRYLAVFVFGVAAPLFISFRAFEGTGVPFLPRVGKRGLDLTWGLVFATVPAAIVIRIGDAFSAISGELASSFTSQFVGEIVATIANGAIPIAAAIVPLWIIKNNGGELGNQLRTVEGKVEQGVSVATGVAASGAEKAKDAGKTAGGAAAKGTAAGVATTIAEKRRRERQDGETMSSREMFRSAVSESKSAAAEEVRSSTGGEGSSRLTSNRDDAIFKPGGALNTVTDTRDALSADSSKDPTEVLSSAAFTEDQEEKITDELVREDESSFEDAIKSGALTSDEERFSDSSEILGEGETIDQETAYGRAAKGVDEEDIEILLNEMRTMSDNSEVVDYLEDIAESTDDETLQETFSEAVESIEKSGNVGSGLEVIAEATSNEDTAEILKELSEAEKKNAITGGFVGNRLSPVEESDGGPQEFDVPGRDDESIVVPSNAQKRGSRLEIDGQPAFDLEAALAKGEEDDVVREALGVEGADDVEVQVGETTDGILSGDPSEGDRIVFEEDGDKIEVTKVDEEEWNVERVREGQTPNEAESKIIGPEAQSFIMSEMAEGYTDVAEEMEEVTADTEDGNEGDGSYNIFKKEGKSGSVFDGTDESSDDNLQPS